MEGPADRSTRSGCEELGGQCDQSTRSKAGSGGDAAADVAGLWAHRPLEDEEVTWGSSRS